MIEMDMEAYINLKKLKGKIPTQTYRTIVGQIRAGDLEGAKIGMQRIKKRMEREEKRHENCSSK